MIVKQSKKGKTEINFREMEEVFDENINAAHLFYNWDTRNIKEISLLIYQNAKNRFFLQKQKKESPLSKFLKKTNRENIFSFHFKIFNNILPIYNKENECKFCKKHGVNGWHLILECEVTKEIEKKMLMKIGYSNNTALNYIDARKKITKTGTQKKAVQSLIWTRNWAIWKLYNDHTHN